ncbi:mediator of RNA polymerase II transcription subunit 28-like [Wolffia australiana]
MADRQPGSLQQLQSHDQQHQSKPAAVSGSPREETLMSYVLAMEAALLPCLPARELQAIDRSAHSSHQTDVERYARDFMEAATKLQLYFLGLQHENKPTREQTLQKEIALMEEELKTKSALIKKHEALLQRWRKDLKEQMDQHRTELERV